jgi:hypothetical protein
MGTRKSVVEGQRARTFIALSALLLISGGTVACDEGTYVAGGTVDYGYEYYYPTTYYYPADLAYSSYYWSDAWLYDDWYFSRAPQQAGGNTRRAVGDALRALARGETICPGQVDVTPKTSAPACEVQGTSAVRSGVTVVFSGCETSSGGTIDGTVDVTAMRSASEQICSPNTLVTLSHTTTLTDLTYTSASGERWVVPDQVDSGTNTYTYGQLPTNLSINSSGRFQVFAADGTLVSDHNHNGTRMVTYSAVDRSYSVSGLINTQDVKGGATANLTGTDIKRGPDCCYPTGGTLSVSRAGGTNPGSHLWTFGPECGQASFDGTAVTPPACP